MDNKKIVIFGAGSFAELMAYYLTKNNKYEIDKFVVDDVYFKEGDVVDKTPVVSFSAYLEQNIQNEKEALHIAIGYKDMRARRSIFARFSQDRIRLINYISPDATIDSSVTIGVNTVIMPGVILEPFVEIGDNCIIWSGAIICHHSKIADHCFVAANTTIGGAVTVGNTSFLGFSSTVIQNIVLGEETLLGAGSVLAQDTNPSAAYKGIPAKKFQEHKANGIKIS